MAGLKIVSIKAREVLDSRGNPTVEVDITTKKGIGRAIVPSGASTGKYEALELRDKDKRYHGRGVLNAVSNIREKIAPKLVGMSCNAQRKIDSIMIKMDGTSNKSALGANSILGVSMASARAAALSTGKPLYSYLHQLAQKNGIKKELLLPVPFSNVINGGKHAGSQLKIQEFMIVPVGASSFSEAAQMVSEVYHTLKQKLESKFGRAAVNVGDEGGFAPPISNAEEALSILESAISESGYSQKVKLAIDSAASEFYSEGSYKLEREYQADELIDYYLNLADSYPIISFEDPFDQDDFKAFKRFTAKIRAKYGDSIQVVGDDLLVTNISRIKIGIRKKCCTALLLKLNQIGTLSEALRAAALAFRHGWNVMVSHRSGETEDPFIADLSVALGCGQIKLGAPCRSERTSKFNQLLRIEEELGSEARYAGQTFKF
ncbi:MAG: phosphopyruvate hydratase [Candidatus Woesearchaeota archaeon]